jgi:hypothetical protein
VQIPSELLIIAFDVFHSLLPFFQATPALQPHATTDVLDKRLSLYETLHVMGTVKILKKYCLLSLSHRLSVNATQNKVTFKALEIATNYPFSTRLRGYVCRSVSHAVGRAYQINQSWK